MVDGGARFGLVTTDAIETPRAVIDRALGVLGVIERSWLPAPDYAALDGVRGSESAAATEAKRMLDATVDHGAKPSSVEMAMARGQPAPAVDEHPIDARIPGHASFHGRLGTEGWTWHEGLP